MSGLKPCAHCGGAAKSCEHWPSWDTRGWVVYCYDECGAAVTRKTEAEAIAAWNHSPAPTGEPVAWKNYAEDGDWWLTDEREPVDSCDYSIPLYPNPDFRVAELEAALEPVMHWYQSDEHEPRPLVDILTDVVADLQHDRAEALKVAAMKAAGDGLAEYTVHLSTCEIMTHGVFSDPIPCTCGLDESKATWEALVNV